MAQADRTFRGGRFEDAKAKADADRVAMEAGGWTFAGQEVSKDPADGGDQLVYHYTAPDAPIIGVAVAANLPAAAATPRQAPVVKQPAKPPAPAKSLPRTVVRTYHGSEQDAAQQFQRDAANLAKQGYRPTGQTWAPGSYGCGCFLVAVLLFVFVIGLLIFLYLLMVKPSGTLTVTYTLADTPVTVVNAPVAAGLTDQLEQLARARDAGLITPAEYDSKRAEILRRL